MQALINIDVDDLEKAIGFYETAFGLKVSRRIGVHVVELLGSSAPIYLLAKGSDTAASNTTPQRRTYDRHWTPVHLDFVVEEIESAVRRAVDAGALLEKAVSTRQWGKLALMSDPFGHGFCFVEFIGRGYHEITD